MQKKLIALAIAGLSSAAFAQSNVTIYGVADATYDNVSATGATAATGSLQGRGRTTMNSSYIGFKGVESLGNGLAVAFQLESGFGENGGATNTVGATAYTLANRDTYVGLAGGFGTIAFGTLTGPARALGAAMDVNAGATGIGANSALLGKIGGGAGAGYIDQRFANAIAYISPNLSGFSGVLAYVPNENRSADAAAGAATANTDAWTLGLNYANGPITLGYAYTDIKDKSANATVASSGLGLTTGAAKYVGTAYVSKVTDNRLAGKYDFGAGTIGLMWDQIKADVTSASGVAGGLLLTPTALGATANAKQTTWFIPVTFKVGGAGKVIAQYGKTKASGSLYTALGVNENDFGAKQFTLGYEYSLSKRTLVKAVYSQISNDRLATYDFLYGVSAPNGTGPTAGVSGGSDPRGVSLGLRHSF